MSRFFYKIFLFIFIIVSCVSSYDVWNDGQFLVTWAVDSSTSTITFKFDVGTTGWASIGFSPDGYMANSDIIMGYVDSSGQAQVSDRWASGRVTPELDTSLKGSNDLFGISGTVSNGRTKLQFSRKLDTGDKYDFSIKQGVQINVIFSIRSTGNPSTENGQYNPHTKFAQAKLVLWENNNPSPITPSTTISGNIYTMDLLMNNYEIPKSQTTYACQYFQIDQLLQTQMKTTNLPKYHAIKFEPISKSNFVHHMIIYNCIQSTVYKQGIFDCMHMPIFCSVPMGLAGANTAPLIMPDQAGFLWGSGGGKIVALQIHYNNDNAEVGKIDNSGMRVSFTDKLRTYNMATATLGYFEPLIKLDPKQSSIVLSETCSAKCTNKIPSTGIFLSIVMLHGHQLMSKTKLKINYSNGAADNSNIGTDNYDFGTQYYKTFDPPIKFSAQDTITTICEYNTMSRTNITYGGHSSYEEMCYAFITYYPAEVGFDMCIGGQCPSYRDVNTFTAPGVPPSSASTYIRNTSIIFFLIVAILC